MPTPRTALPTELLSGPFTAPTAVAAGLRPSALKGPSVRRVAPRVFAAGADLDLLGLVKAHLLTLPSDVLVDGLTALQLYGVEVGEQWPLRFCSPAGRDVRRAGARVRRVQRAPAHRSRTVEPVEALVAAAADLSLVELVVAGDWLIRAELVSQARLAAALAGVSGRHARTLRRVGTLVRAKVDSPQESRLRMMLVLAGLPHPDCNVDIGNEHFFIARVDLCFRAWKLLVEYEGDQHRVSKKQWDRDIDRFEWLDEEGYVVIRVTGHRMRRPQALVESVFAALVRAGYDGPAPVYSQEWLRAFASGNSSRLPAS